MHFRGGREIRIHDEIVIVISLKRSCSLRVLIVVDISLPYINLIRSLVKRRISFPTKIDAIFNNTHCKIITKCNDFERYSTLNNESKRFSIITFLHWTNIREREGGRDREKKKKGEKKWTQVQINLIPWRQRIERYVRSRLRENPVTIVTRFAKCVLSLSRALTAVIDEYKANISRPRKLGKNGRDTPRQTASFQRDSAQFLFFFYLYHIF